MDGAPGLVQISLQGTYVQHTDIDTVLTSAQSNTANTASNIWKTRLINLSTPIALQLRLVEIKIDSGDYPVTATLNLFSKWTTVEQNRSVNDMMW